MLYSVRPLMPTGRLPVPSFDVLSDAELARLDVAIDAIPARRLREKTAAVLLRSGMRAVDITHAPRSGFSHGEREYPPQLRYPCKDGEETTVLSRPHGEIVAAYLRTHDSGNLMPGISVETLLNVLDGCLYRADVRRVTAGTLRNTVRLVALSESEGTT